jgi:hypothetical protein
MNATTHAPRWHRLFDRGCTWGSIDVYPARYGVVRYRLMVFPPGLQPQERTLLHAWRTCRVWVTVLWLALEMILVPVMGAGMALVVATGLCLAVLARVLVTTAAHRSRVRTLSVVRMAGYDDEDTAAELERMGQLVEALTEADRRLANGEVTTVEHEALVWSVYDRLSPVPA